MLPEPNPPRPKFQWISGGILLVAAACCWAIWAYRLPDKAGEKPLEFRSLLELLGFFLFAGAIWQYIRYRTFKEDVAKGALVKGSGPPSHIWGFVKALFSSPTVHTGARGGQYTVDHKGNKKYKHRR